MTCHVDTATAASYSARYSDALVSASVEAHLLVCEKCRAMVNTRVDTHVLDEVWRGIEDALDAPRPGWVERSLLAAGCSERTGRIVAATTRARWAYLFVVAFNVAIG